MSNKFLMVKYLSGKEIFVPAEGERTYDGSSEFLKLAKENCPPSPAKGDCPVYVCLYDMQKNTECSGRYYVNVPDCNITPFSYDGLLTTAVPVKSIYIIFGVDLSNRFLFRVGIDSFIDTFRVESNYPAMSRRYCSLIKSLLVMAHNDNVLIRNLMPYRISLLETDEEKEVYNHLLRKLEPWRQQ